MYRQAIKVLSYLSEICTQLVAKDTLPMFKMSFLSLLYIHVLHLWKYNISGAKITSNVLNECTVDWLGIRYTK